MFGKKKAKAKANKDLVEVEYKVSMHCNACERSVAKAISKVKGVEKFITDMKNHRVIVTGRIDPQKVRKKLKKKTGKKVELVVQDEDAIIEDEQISTIEVEWLDHYYGENEMFLMFNDENPNSCSIM